MTKTRVEMWLDFAAQALAGNLSRNAYTECQAVMAAKAADTMMEEFDRRFVFDVSRGFWLYREAAKSGA